VGLALRAPRRRADRAVVHTATDDTLTGAVATIDGTTTRGDFVLSHTCLPVTTPTPSASVSPTASPSVSASETAGATPGAEVSGTVLTSSPTHSISPAVLGVRETRDTGTLPDTGRSPVVLLMIAGLLVAGGALLLTRPGGRHAR
jgi:LPXTG-motif cell wall-anchored protein